MFFQPSNYYGGAVLSDVKVQEFDPQKDPVLTSSNSVKLNIRSEHRTLLKNWDYNSNYIGFSSSSQVGYVRPHLDLVNNNFILKY